MGGTFTWKILLFSGLILTSFVCAEPASPAKIKPIQYGPRVKIAKLDNREVNESSGLAVSRVHAGVFWTHNDSCDTPRIFAFDKTGRSLAEISVEGAEARDWEDIASFERTDPKTGVKKSYLLIADTGNNQLKKRICTLYLIAEPKLDISKTGVKGRARVIQKIRFTYADGPHDCEAMAVDTTSNTILLVTKRGYMRHLYELPFPDPKDTRIHKLKPAARLNLIPPTAMDISPDGRRAVVLSYLGAYQFIRQIGESWAKALSRPPTPIALPLIRQREAMCYGQDGKTLYVTREGKPMPLIKIEEKAPPKMPATKKSPSQRTRPAS